MEKRETHCNSEPKTDDALPSRLKITCSPSWARLNDLPPWPELLLLVYHANEHRWSDPAMQHLHADMWHLFNRARTIIARDLDSTQWDLVTSTSLVSFYQACFCAELGILGVVPEEISSPQDREDMFFDVLIRKDILDPSSPSRLVPDLATSAFIACYAGPAVEAEIIRRIGLHIGAHAGILKICYALCKDYKDKDEDRILEYNERLTDSEKKLVKFITGNLAFRLTSYPYSFRKDILNQIPSQICLTLQTDDAYKEIDPFQALADSLDGKWNIAPQRVADRIRIKLKVEVDRPLMREMPHEIDRKGRVVMKGIYGETITVKMVEDRKGKGDLEVDLKAFLEEFLKKNPQYEDTVRVVLSDEPQKMLAEDRGITVRALYDRIEKFMTAFKRYCDKR